MKSFVRMIFPFSIALAIVLSPSSESDAQVSVSYQVFYDELSPYGFWVDNSSYGFVWVPNVSPNFSPYSSDGSWIYTEIGWTWVSNYSWGWAPFHYGRWFSDPVYGPIWVPGKEWGPGWVTWRASACHFGWAPIAPGINSETAYGDGYELPFNQWTFVSTDSFGMADNRGYHLKTPEDEAMLNKSEVIMNVQTLRTGSEKYHAGPMCDEVENYTGRPVLIVVLKGSEKPGQELMNGELLIYMPVVQDSIAGGRMPRPSTVVDIKEVYPGAEPIESIESQPFIMQQSQQGKQRNNE